MLRSEIVEPEDVIWRALERLREAREFFAESAAALHPKFHRDVIDALFECERLSQNQINLLHRVQRRYDRPVRP